MIKPEQTHSTYGVRLAMLEAIIEYNGVLRSQEFADIFNMQLSYAHKIIGYYRELHPNHITYNSEGDKRGFVKTDSYGRNYLMSKTNAGEFLANYERLHNVKVLSIVTC